MSFSSRLSSMVERNVTAEELGTSKSAPPPLDIILPVVLLAFFLVVLIAWRWARYITAPVHSFKHFVTVSPLVWFPDVGEPRATLRIRILFWREVSQLRWGPRALRPLLQIEDNTIMTIHAWYSLMNGTRLGLWKSITTHMRNESVQAIFANEDK